MVTEKIKQQLLRETTDNTQVLLTFCRDQYGVPVEALMALILGSGSLAVGIGMSREDLLEGVGKAWDLAQDARKEGNRHAH